ncbi:MAG: HDOD domain-containing protein [Acidobacteriota bacterium]|nr:HDOD domain-containing protein [Acidobacteriota bacterium]
MHLSSDNVDLESTEMMGSTTLEPRLIPLAPHRTDDPEARQSRKLALMSALSDGLPTLPAYVFQLNSLLAATPVNLKRVAEVIRTDPSLAAQVLRLCNSAFMGFRDRVNKIEHAVMLVGTERLRTMVLTCSLVEYVGHRVASEDVQSFWQHCFLTAALSERLARGISYSHPEEAYLAGLLHDIGALPLLVVNSAELSNPESVASCGWGESIELERKRFGMDHCEVGHWIGISWNFSPTLLEVMVRHHNPLQAIEDPQLVGVVAAADQFCVRRGIVLGAEPPELTEPTDNQDQGIFLACLPQLKPPEAEKLAEMIETDFLHLIQLMEFGASGLFGGGIPQNPFRE